MDDRGPATIMIVESNPLIVSGSGLTMPLQRDLCCRLSLPNPRYVQAQKFGRWVGKIPDVLRYYQETPAGALIAPRGALSMILAIVRSHGIECRYHDETLTVPPVTFDAHMKLSDAQERAVEETLTCPKGNW